MSALENTDRVSTLLQHIRAGCNIDKSCTVARIPRRSYYDWLTEGEMIAADVPPEDRTERQLRVLEFCDSVDLAKAQSVTSLELVVAQAARQEWRAAVTLLKKHESGLWSGAQRVELTGPQGAPITVQPVPPDLSDVDVARPIWEARAEMGDAVAVRLIAALNDD